MNREEFLARRKHGIGGSDISAIMGHNPYKTAYDIYLDKRGEAEPQPTSEASHFGTILEDVVANEYTLRTGNKVQRVNAQLKHPDYNFAVANIDRAVIVPEIAKTVRWKDGRLTTNRILECKTANAHNTSAWGVAGSQKIPVHYYEQIQWYMGITKCNYADLSVLIGGQTFITYSFDFNASLFEEMIVAAGKAWDGIMNGNPPEPTTLDDAQKMWKRHTSGKSVIVDMKIADACEKLEAIKTEMEKLKAEEKAVRLDIVNAFRDAEEITYDGRVLATWKTQTRNSFDATRFKSDHPDIAEQYMKQSESRVLRIK